MANRRRAAAPSEAAIGKRLAQKLLETLPELDATRRKLYRAQFSELQCRDWGDRTWGKDVLRDAERTVGAAHALLKAVDVPGFPLVRLRWLCELIVELQRAIEEDALPEHRVLRGEAKTLAARARRLRTQATNRLKAALVGNGAALTALSKEQPSKPTPQQLPGLLEKLAARGRALRKDEALVLLADDAALTDEYLASLQQLANELTLAVQATFGGPRTNDSVATSHAEGRVLRELAFLCDQVKKAREGGTTVDALPLPPTVRAASRRK